jgi:DNA-binding NtrC family response regulator
MSGPMTGYDLAREASTRYPHLKVLLATGYASQSLALPKPEENHFTVLHKPVPLRELAANIRNELERGASRQPVG